MNYLKKLYGKTVIDGSDSEELTKDNKIELEYYQIKNETSSKPYGIEIVKRKIENDIMNIEEKTVRHICNEEKESNKLLEILMSNKVTPVAVEDIIEDLSKIKVCSTGTQTFEQQSN